MMDRKLVVFFIIYIVYINIEILNNITLNDDIWDCLILSNSLSQ